MNYIDQLRSPDWLLKRESILERDGFRCQNCFNRSLFKHFSISLVGMGLNSKGKLCFTVFDKVSKSERRYDANLTKSQGYYLYQLAKEKSIIALTSFNESDCLHIATILVPKKLKYSDIRHWKATDKYRYEIERQSKQERYFKLITNEDLSSLKWYNTLGLHVHHKYYEKYKLAWDYDDSALITLCWDCHSKLHGNELIEYRYQYGSTCNTMKPCSRCNGLGWIPKYHHVERGICFKCEGKRFIEYFDRQ